MADSPDAPASAPPVSAKTPLALQMQARWIAPAALVVAVIAVAVAIWALLSPTNTSTAPVPTGRQIADAKARACASFTVVRSAVALQTHAGLGNDPVAVQAVAANARLSMSAGASYLLASVDPATPGDLAAAIGSFAKDLQDISMYAQAGVANDDPAQAARLHDGETLSLTVAGLCK